MSLHDFRCPQCGHVVRDYNVPVEIGAKAGAPICPACTLIRTEVIPQVGRMDAYEPFQEFQTRDCYGRTVTVESLTQLRKLEDESQREYRSGPRDAAGSPIAQQTIWRDYAQDRSNRDVHSFAKHLDRDMTMQDDRIDARSDMIGQRGASERDLDQLAGKDVAFSGGDVLGEAGS